MRLPLLILGGFILFSIGIDLYIYRRLKTLTSRWPSRIQLWTSIALYLMVAVAVCLPRRGGDNNMLLSVMWMLFIYATVYTSKFIFLIFDVIASVPRLWHRRRISGLSITGIALSGITFIAMWWGALINRFDIDINEITVEIPGLPSEFEGYRIVQFSDFHVGTYGNDTTFVAKVVDRINSLQPDLIVFTGDIVNSISSELKPHSAPLSRLKAGDGIISILGNHDYGDYSFWPDESAKQANLKYLIDLQKRMNWRLLLNETEIIKRGSDSICIIGVENIGDPPFHCYGSLEKAYPEITDSITKILLSHNPAHWTDSIADSDKNIALTLSGHTHAMQMEIGGWSPAKFRYPTWGGLYSDHKGNHKLYVNIGIGTVGFPARIGAKPELTVITLKQAN